MASSIGARAQQRPGAEKLLVGVQIVGAIGHQTLARLQTQGRTQRPGDGLRDLLLYGEDVGQLAVVVLGPELDSVAGADELRRDAHAVAGLAHRALDQVACAHGLTHGADVLVLALELKCGAARDDTQVPHFGERAADFIGHAVREEFAARIS